MKKKSEKKSAVETGMGYCPFSLCVESQYSRLYRDTRCAEGAWIAVTAMIRSGGRPTTRSSSSATRPAHARG